VEEAEVAVERHRRSQDVVLFAFVFPDPSSYDALRTANGAARPKAAACFSVIGSCHHQKISASSSSISLPIRMCLTRFFVYFLEIADRGTFNLDYGRR